jgi:hypothetical protein
MKEVDTQVEVSILSTLMAKDHVYGTMKIEM